MKINPLNNAAFEPVAKLIEPIRVAMLSNLDEHGELAGRPMAPLEMDSDGAIWFFTDLRSSKVEHLRVVNLSFADPDRAVFVSISGHGEIDVERQRIERLWTSAALPWFPEGPDSPHLALLKVVPHGAEIWDAPHSSMVRSFAMAASIASGRPVGLGTHQTIGDPSSTTATG